MKQNPDCMRDVLKAIETIQGYDENGIIKKLSLTELFESEFLDGYSEGDIKYSVKQLAGSGLIELRIIKELRQERYEILDITAKGHSFLHNIRTDKVWSEIKKRAKIIGSSAVEALIAIAAKVIIDKI